MQQGVVTDQSLSGVPVLVTGASGFIGTHLCVALQKQGALVHAVSRKEQPPGEGMTWWRRNLATKSEVEDLLDETQAEIVYHLSGAITASEELQMVQTTFESLLQSTLYFLEAVTTKGSRRLILTGSLNEPVGGVDAVPTSPYSAAKWMSCSYARMFHRLYKTPVVILRLFMGYGPGQNPAKVIPSTINSYLSGLPPMLTSGSFTTDWIYISDLVDGLIKAATVPGIEGQTFDLASGETASVKDIALMLKDIIGSPLDPIFGSLPDRTAGQMRTADIGNSAKILGWQPQITLKEGLTKTVAWYRQQQELSIGKV